MFEMKLPDLRWDQDEGDYDDDLLLDVEAGIVAYLIRGRNAWQSTWVRHWFHDAHLFSDVSSARLGAESLRERGNVFYVRETPAVLLRGPSGGVVLCNPGVDDPFSGFTGFETTPVETEYGNWIDGIYPGVSLRDAVSAFDEDSDHWLGSRASERTIRAGAVPADFAFSHRVGDLQSLRSYAQGVNYLLGWVPDLGPRPFKMNGSKAVAKRWRDRTRLVSEDSVSRHGSAAAFAEYRDQVLSAEPYSLWDARVEALKAAIVAEVEMTRIEWTEAIARRRGIEAAIHRAQAELQAAREDRLRPSETSAGVRAQRERFEGAERALAGLLSDLAISKALEQLRFDDYLKAGEAYDDIAAV